MKCEMNAITYYARELSEFCDLTGLPPLYPLVSDFYSQNGYCAASFVLPCRTKKPFV